MGGWLELIGVDVYQRSYNLKNVRIMHCYGIVKAVSKYL